MNHILICLLTLLFSLSGPAMGEYSDFGQSSNAARGTPQLALPGLSGSVDEVVVIGRQVDTAVAKNWTGHNVLDIQNWTIPRNDAFMQSVIQNKQKVYLGTPQTRATLWDAKNARPTVFSRELDQLKAAGYTQQGDYMLPPMN